MTECQKSSRGVQKCNIRQSSVSSLSTAEGHKHGAFLPVNIIERVPGGNYPQKQAIAFFFGKDCFSSWKEKPQWYAMWTIRRLRTGSELKTRIISQCSCFLNLVGSREKSNDKMKLSYSRILLQLAKNCYMINKGNFLRFPGSIAISRKAELCSTIVVFHR